MEHAISLGNSRVEEALPRHFMLDTTFVLFFLGMDIGQSVGSFGSDGLLSAITLLLFVVLPYFLPTASGRPDFTGWVIGRIFIAAFAVVLGMMFKQTLGTVFPESFRYLPMTLLIVASIFCCYVQVYGMIRFRLAR